jgi:hypothetical protein
MKPKTPAAKAEKRDAAGAMAPSKADPKNNGLHSANPQVLSGDGDATRKPDKRSRGQPSK